MKAIITKGYGSSEVLEVGELEKPEISDQEILVKVRAASVNPVDWKIRKGSLKLMTGIRPPRVLGGDFAGVVAEVGSGISKYKIGDEVFGLLNAFKGGAYAEFVKAGEENLGLKPENITFTEAASLPLVALTGYQALMNECDFKSGQRVLVNGCSGGVGLATIQIVRAMAGIGTGVCSSRNVSFAREMGAHEVIDYQQEDFLLRKDSYDIFFDVVANQSFDAVRKTLSANGFYVTTLPGFSLLILSPILNHFRSRKAKKIFVQPSAADLEVIRQMVIEGKLKPVVEKVYSYNDVREAHKVSEAGRVVGKIVLDFDN